MFKKKSTDLSGGAADELSRVRRQHHHPVFSEIIAVLFGMAVICCLVLAGIVLNIGSELPQITAADLINAQTSFVYDDQGQEFATLHGGENRVTVDLDAMPQHLIDAVIASEDIRFYEHHGVDFRSLIRAAVVDVMDSLRNRSLTFTQGASTITMQLVKNVIGETEKTLTRKIKQILLALELEKSYTKDEILYYYMNEIYLGSNVYGMQSASWYYFNKDVQNISISEAAELVAILRAPAYYSPYDNPQRTIGVRNAILGLMADYKPDAYSENAMAAMADAVSVYYGDDDDAGYDHPWFVDYVVSEAIGIMEKLGYSSDYVYTGGLRIYTTMDASVQSAMETVYSDASNFPSGNTGDIIESAMAIVEPNTGKIKGLMGGRVYTARRGFNRAADLVRSSGSTIKPLVTYAPAIELGYGAGTIIQDQPLEYPNGWAPKNDDGSFAGYITMRTAVTQSRNVCAVRTLEAIGAETGYSYGVKLGLPLVPDDANLSLTLGGLTYGVAPLDMAAAFAVFPSGGVFTEQYSITRIEDMNGKLLYSVEPQHTQVFSEATAYIMTDILMDAVSYGTGTNAKISGWQTAGKTGTNGLPSEDPDYSGRSGSKDAWFCGYTTALSGAVWMGYDNKKDENGYLQYLNFYGSSYPARIFSKVMTLALANYENKNFEVPEGITYRVANSGGRETYAATYGYGDMWVSGGDYLGLIGDPAVYVTVQLCSDTGRLATEYCPHTYSDSVLEDDVPGYCTTHTKSWLEQFLEGQQGGGDDNTTEHDDGSGNNGYDWIKNIVDDYL